MKFYFTLLTLVFTLFFNDQLVAQEKTDDEPKTVKFGLGVSFFNLTDVLNENFPVSTIYLTADLGKILRIEPSFKLAISEFNRQYEIGAGVFGKRTLPKFNMLYGARFAYSNDKVTTIAPTLGGEYYFSDHFSLSGEAQLKTLIVEKQWLIYSNANIILRYYF